MFKIKVEMKGLDKLDKHIDYVNKMLKMKTDEKFQKFIQDKCMQTLKKVMNERLTFFGQTVENYKANNFIQEEPDGFIIYNHTMVETNSEGYGGEFSIALAFEYGTGIVGAENPKENAWAYNINGHKSRWVYFKNEQFWWTKGYEGFEIYRYTAIEIEKNLSKWVNEYYRKKV